MLMPKLQNYTGFLNVFFFFKLRIDPIPTSHRQGSWVASVSLYVTDVTVVTEGLGLGLALDPKIDPL